MKVNEIIRESGPAIAHALIPSLLKKGDIIHFTHFGEDSIIHEISRNPTTYSQYRIHVGKNPADDCFVPDEYLENSMLKKIGTNEWRLIPDFTHRMSSQAGLDKSPGTHPVVHDWATQLE